MTKVGIIAGGGKLPYIIGKSLINSKYEVFFLCIKNFCNIEKFKKYSYEIISINSLTSILKILKKNKIDKIVMAGNVKRPSLKDIKFDINTLKLIKNFALNSKGDDQLLSSISKFFEDNGFSILDWKKECRDLFITDDVITNNKPDLNSLKNKVKGLKVFEGIGKVDLSQSLIIQNEIILGIEAAEGTDELLRRCYKYKKKGDRGILLKLSKYKQNTNFDLPVIGLETVKKIKKYDYKGIFLEKNQGIIIDKEKVIKFCNNNKIFIASVVKN